MKQLHEIQLAILLKLIYSPWMKYMELLPYTDLPTNQFSFHLNKLLQLGYIEKMDDLYALTISGKVYANMINKHTCQMHTTVMLAVLVVCTKTLENGQLSFLIYTRKKHPFYGRQWILSWKVQYGENIITTAERVLHEKTWLAWTATTSQILHYTDKDKKTGAILDDKVLFLCYVEEPVGDIVCDETWDAERVKESDLVSYIKNTFRSQEDTIQLLYMAKDASKQSIVIEKEWYIESF